MRHKCTCTEVFFISFCCLPFNFHVLFLVISAYMAKHFYYSILFWQFICGVPRLLHLQEQLCKNNRRLYVWFVQSFFSFMFCYNFGIMLFIQSLFRSWFTIFMDWRLRICQQQSMKFDFIKGYTNIRLRLWK